MSTYIQHHTMSCVSIEITQIIHRNIRVSEKWRLVKTEPKEGNAICPDPNPHPASVGQGSCFSCRRIRRAVCRWKYRVVSLTETEEPINLTRSVCLLSFRFFWRTPSEDRNKRQMGWSSSFSCEIIARLLIRFVYSYSFCCNNVHSTSAMMM